VGRGREGNAPGKAGHNGHLLVDLRRLRQRCVAPEIVHLIVQFKTQVRQERGGEGRRGAERGDLPRTCAEVASAHTHCANAQVYRSRQSPSPAACGALTQKEAYAAVGIPVLRAGARRSRT
jgi:hypothetical protein